MNFAYLDPVGSLISELVRPHPVPDPIETIPCELDESWVAFETELGKFKNEFTKNRHELVQKMGELGEKNDEINILKMMRDNVKSQGLKDSIEAMIGQYESVEGISALIQQCGAIKGRVAAQRKVLTDTNAEKYGKFICFVCMDRLVDLFFDPCGHVICEPCWARTRNKRECPGCRTRLNGTQKIYTMNS